MIQRFFFAALILSCPARALAAAPPDVKPRNDAPGVTQKQLWERAKKDAAVIEKHGTSAPRSEAALMYHAVQNGSMLGGGEGWFGPSKTRYDWKRLAERFDKNGDGRITGVELGRPGELARSLDRDRSGAVTKEDLDWSKASTFLREEARATRFFRGMDRNGDGHLSEAEWSGYFKKLSKGGAEINPEALRLALYPPPRRSGGGGRRGPAARTKMLGYLVRGDLGSPFEGPRLGELAPDFTLPTHDGKSKITLSELRGGKPVVLIFGSFT